MFSPRKTPGYVRSGILDQTSLRRAPRFAPQGPTPSTIGECSSSPGRQHGAGAPIPISATLPSRIVSLSTPLRSLVPTAAVLMALASPLAAQAQPADIYWADNWNVRYHHFSDVDGDGQFLSHGEVSLHVADGELGTNRTRDIRVTEENGVLVTYWLYETNDIICRGVDVNGDGVLSGPAEVKVFRDSGVLDGGSVPSALDVTDDGALWWTSAFLLSQPVNGLLRLEDLNGDGDAADAGEQVQMVDGNVPHTVEHDLGTATTLAWSMTDMAAAGDGVVCYASNDDVHYRFEDKNHDGDVLDAGESILLLNATGTRPDLPMNPDFVDGTLKNPQTPAGYATQFKYVATSLENGERAFYFGTSASPFNPSSAVNLLGQGLNFLIFRGVDGNGDGDVNDAGEVRTFYDGSSTDGDPDLLILRGLDVLDGGTLYAVGLTPYPALFPGPNGNTWIHRFEDLDGDGDAMDPGERQLDIFDLQVHGYDPVVFPLPPLYGNVMSDPWGFEVHRLSPFTDMGGGSPGTSGVPRLSGSGDLTGSSLATFDVVNTNPNALMLSWISFSSSPLSVLDGTLYTIPSVSELFWAADGTGSLSIPVPWPAGLPSGVDLWLQFVVQDTGIPKKMTLTNGLKLTTP